jgi:uncharacterized membrane protein
MIINIAKLIFVIVCAKLILFVILVLLGIGISQFNGSSNSNVRYSTEIIS